MRDVKMANATVIFFYFGTRRDRKLIVVDSSCHGNLGKVTSEIFVWWGAEEPLAYPSLFC